MTGILIFVFSDLCALCTFFGFCVLPLDQLRLFFTGVGVGDGAGVGVGVGVGLT